MSKKKIITAIVAAAIIIAAGAFTGVFIASKNAPKDVDFEKVRQQIFDYEMYFSDLTIDEINCGAEEAYSTINNDGSFPDIDYTAQDQTNWKPANHLSRLRKLVVSYVNPNGAYYKNHEAYEKIIAGLTFWQNANPVSTNWYMQEISSPQNIGAMLVMMRFGDERIDKKLETDMLSRMEETGGSPKKWTGANKSDISVHYIYRGALTENSKLIKIATSEAFSTLCFTTDEGFQHDGSYQQHGPQLYITGYGQAIVDSLSKIISATAGTEYAIKDEQLEPLQKFITEGYIRVVRGKYRLYNTGGRSLSREDSLDMSGDALMYEKLRYIDKKNEKLYSDVLSSIKGEGGAAHLAESKATHFWRSDYSLYTSPKYTFDVRAVSTRTARNENGNGENIKGYFLADGAYTIAVSGDEYLNIFPAWDYAMIPGTTAPHVAEIPLPNEWSHLGQSSFAGGVSNGDCGIAAYAYTDNEFSISARANKSYFMLGDCIVCLGSEIEAESEGEMRTTLNQCLSNGEICLINKDGSITEFTDEEQPLTADIAGVYHSNIAYLFLDDNKKVLKSKEQSGKWTDINTSSDSDEPVTKKVFTLYENHGERPNDEGYSYIILPGISSKDEAASFNMESIEILSSANGIHAVKASDGKIYAVFFKAGTFNIGDEKITANKPCAIIIDGDKIYASNPDQKIKKATVTIERKSGTKAADIKFFHGKSALAGSAVTAALK